MIIDILMWQGWSLVFLFWAVASLFFAAYPFDDQKGKHHLVGAEIFVIQWILTNAVGDLSAAPLAVFFFSLTDVVFGAIFLFFALKKRAVWAAVCVLTHFGMGLAHLKMYGGDLHSFYYILTLNILYSVSIASNNLAVWAGRYDRSRLLDRLFNHIIGRPTFSGFRVPGGKLFNPGVG